MEKKQMRKKRGFTLIELLVVMGIIGILASVVLVAVNPAHQFAVARDTQRVSNITAILNAVGENMSENRGQFVCNGVVTNFLTTSMPIRNASTSPGVDAFDAGPCLVPTYLSAMPFDPTKPGAHFTSVTDYDSGYYISQDTNGRINIHADGEITPTISVTR